MIGVCGIESGGRIEGFLKVYQIVILLDRTEHAQFAVQKTVEHLLGHVHIGGEVLHVFVQYDSLPVHETEGDTVAGFIRASIEGDVVVLLQSCLFYLFLSVLFPLSSMEMPRSDATRRKSSADNIFRFL